MRAIKFDKKLIFLVAVVLLSLIPGYGWGTELPQKEQPKASDARDPVIARADIVFDDLPSLIPFIAKASNNDLILTCTNWGDVKPGTVTYFLRSTNGGKTWSKPYFIMKSDNPLIGVGAVVQRLPDGNISCGIIEALWVDPNSPGSRLFDYYYCISTDNGKTFGEKKRINDPCARNDFPQGNYIILKDGTLLWPWGHWNPSALNGFKKSVDGGYSWSDVTRAWQDPPKGESNPLNFSETAVVQCNDGTIVAVARVDTKIDKKFWQITSSDNGQTWSMPRQIPAAGDSPALYCTSKGQLWLAYRDCGLGPGLGLSVSDDNGQSWRFLYHLKDPKGEYEKKYAKMRWSKQELQKLWRPADSVDGYPCFQKLSDDEVYVVFHMMNTELTKKFAVGADPFYVVGNLLRIPR